MADPTTEQAILQVLRSGPKPRPEAASTMPGREPGNSIVPVQRPTEPPGGWLGPFGPLAQSNFYVPPVAPPTPKVDQPTLDQAEQAITPVKLEDIQGALGGDPTAAPPVQPDDTYTAILRSLSEHAPTSGPHQDVADKAWGMVGDSGYQGLCAGFVGDMYEAAGKHFPGMRSGNAVNYESGLRGAGKAINQDEALPGDIVAMNGYDGGGNGHIGLYGGERIGDDGQRHKYIVESWKGVGVHAVPLEDRQDHVTGWYRP